MEANPRKDYWVEIFDLQPEDYEQELPHVGMPKKFKTPADMGNAIINYFMQQDEEGRSYTMYGLARRLGYNTSLDHLNRYEGYSERYARIIKIARTIVLEGYEEKLGIKGMGSGVQFGLMNLGGWSKNEKQEITHKDLSISFKQQDPSI